MSLKGTSSATNLLRGSINSLKTLTISAYALAVKHGYEGTEEEWVRSLSGIYVGPGEMPQGYALQVDPSIEAKVVTSVNGVAPDENGNVEVEVGSGSGGDGVSCTHEWNGTVLTVTSASGTSSADLKGDKGDNGEPGVYTLAEGETIEDAPAWAQVVVDPNGGEELPYLDYINTELAKRGQLKPEFANSVAELEESGDTTKLYVLPDGYIYAYFYAEHNRPDITIESQTDGYWGYDENNDRFYWQTYEGATSKLSNKIPVTPGDQLSYRGVTQYSRNYSYAWFDANSVELGKERLSAVDAPVVLTAPENAAFLQCTSFAIGKEAVLEVKWVLCQAATPTYEWESTGHAFVPADYEDRIVALEENAEDMDARIKAIESYGEAASSDPLHGKKIIYDGDSIAESRTSYASNGGGYAKIIADITRGTYVNQAVGGARLTTAIDGASYHSVVDNLPNLPKDGDLYCFEGGINDYWTPKALGTFSKTDYTGELDTNTICGALETIFRYALANFVGKPICFVITHKIQSTAYVENSNGDTFEDYRNAMAGICEKYSIPYYDAFSESGLNGWNTVQNNAFLTANTDGTGDGCHPNAEGYKRYYVPQLLNLFRRIMPV